MRKRLRISWVIFTLILAVLFSVVIFKLIYNRDPPVKVVHGPLDDEYWANTEDLYVSLTHPSLQHCDSIEVLLGNQRLESFVTLPSPVRETVTEPQMVQKFVVPGVFRNNAPIDVIVRCAGGLVEQLALDPEKPHVLFVEYLLDARLEGHLHVTYGKYPESIAVRSPDGDSMPQLRY